MKKMLMAVVAIVLIVVISVSATFAYLTADDSVENTFTVGKVEITLDEAKVNEYGEKVKADGTVAEEGDVLADRVDANTYKLIPGLTYTKDPIVHVDKNSEDCWIFVRIENGLGDNAKINIGADWTLLAGTGNVYAYKEVVGANANVTVFTEFTYSEDVKDPSTDEGKKIIVTAYAVQAEGFENNAAGAWDKTFATA